MKVIRHGDTYSTCCGLRKYINITHTHTHIHIHCCRHFSSIPLGLVLSVVLSLVWLNELLPQPDVRWDTVGVAVYVISALIELPSEPLWVLAQVKGHVTVKVRL